MCGSELAIGEGRPGVARALGEVDVGVRVLLGTVFQHGFEIGDLAVRLADDRHRRPRRGRERHRAALALTDNATERAFFFAEQLR